MLNISGEARGYMKDLLEQEANAGDVIRVAVMGQAGLGLVVDRASDQDMVFDQEQFRVVVDQKLMEFCKSISISFKEGDSANCGSNGYIIETENSI